ncbi:MAG: hypothetical protein ACRD24_05190 [Terriglobales bacterium]
MARRFSGVLIAAGLAVGFLSLPADAVEAATKPAAASVQKAKAKAKSRQKKTPEPVPVATPPVPLLPYQLPPQPPKVTFRNGQLTIAAENATLASVMEQVRTATGATVEAVSFFGGERVSVRLGPGAPRDVLADLLNGSNYNYVLLGSLRNPQGLERVIVTQRGAGASSASAAAPGPARNFPATVRQVPQPPPDEEAEIEPEAEEAPEVQQQVPAETVTPPPQANPQAAPQPGAAPGTPGQTPQVKTPQELLQELQERMRRQQEEQNQERNEQQRQQQEEEEPK